MINKNRTVAAAALCFAVISIVCLTQLGRQNAKHDSATNVALGGEGSSPPQSKSRMPPITLPKDMVLAYQAEMRGATDEALDRYRAIAESRTGSEQIGALNRYVFAMQRKHSKTNGLQMEFDRLMVKEDKSDFEWLFLSQFGSAIDPRKCYEKVMASKSSNFAKYARMKLIFHYDPMTEPDLEAYAQRAMSGLQSFVNETPNGPYADHARMRVASCLKVLGDVDGAVRIYRQLLRAESSDLLIRACCISKLSSLGKATNSASVEKARLIARFYGVRGDGYSMPKSFDPEHFSVEVIQMTDRLDN